MTLKSNLWCGYCGTQDFIEHKDSRCPEDSEYSIWECSSCHATYENNPGYGYFTVDWGGNSPDTPDRYCLNSGELLDDSKLPRTPEGIVRHCDSEEELRVYLARTQVK